MAALALEFISLIGRFRKVCPSKSGGPSKRFFGYAIATDSSSTIWIRETSFTERTVRYFTLECGEDIFDVSLIPGSHNSGFEIVCLTIGGLLIHYKLTNNKDLEIYSEYRLRECVNAVQILGFFWDQYTKRAVVALKTNSHIILTSTVFVERDGKRSLSEYTRIIKDVKSESGAAGFLSIFRSSNAIWQHRFLKMTSAAVGWVFHLISAMGENQQCKLTLTLQCYADNNTGQNLSKEQVLGVIYRPAKNARILVANSTIVVLVETEDSSFVSCWFLKFSIGSKVSLFVLGKPRQLEAIPVNLIDDAMIQNYQIYVVSNGKVFVSTDLRYIDERFDWIERKYLNSDSTANWGAARDYFYLLCASANPEILRNVLRSFSSNEEIGQTLISQVASVIRQGVKISEFLSRLGEGQSGVELTGVSKISMRYDSPIMLFGNGWGYMRDLDIAENVLQKSQVVMGMSRDLLDLIYRALNTDDGVNIYSDDAVNAIFQHPGEGMYEMLLKELEFSSQSRDESLSEEKQYCADTPLEDLVENQLVGVLSKGIQVITFEELGTVLASRFVILTRVLVYLANCSSGRFPQLVSTVRRMLFLRVVALELSSSSKSNWHKFKSGDDEKESWVEARKELLNQEINLWTLNCFKYCTWAWKERCWRCLKILAVILGGISKTRLANVFLGRSILGIMYHDNTLGLTWASGLYSPNELLGVFWQDLMKPRFFEELSHQEKDFLLGAIDPDSSILRDNPSEHKIRVAFGEFVVRVLQSISARMSVDNESSATQWYLRLSKICEDPRGVDDKIVNRAVTYQVTAVQRYLRQLDFDSAHKILVEMNTSSNIRALQQKMDTLRLFIKTACEKKQIGAIVGPDWKSMTAMVEKGIKEYCKMKSSYQFHSHEVLWAFYVAHDKYQKAAQMMFLLLKRLEAKALKLPKTHLAHNVERQLHCMTNLINALSLLPEEKRSVSIAKRKVAGEALRQDEPTDEVLSYNDCIRRYRVLVGWNELFSRVNIMGTDLSQDPASYMKLISGLVDLSKHEMALTTGFACNINVTMVFENYVEWICSFINRDRAPGFSGASMQRAVGLDEKTLWNHLEHYLKPVKSRNDKFTYILAVARKVLGCNSEIESIPGLVLMVLKEVGGRPALVRMLCEFGRLQQANEILQDMAKDGPLDFDLVALVVGHLEQEMRRLISTEMLGKLVEQRDSLIELVIKS